MEAGCDEALQHIVDKHYEDELKEDGYDHIFKYGICFCKKVQDKVRKRNLATVWYSAAQCVINHKLWQKLPA